MKQRCPDDDPSCGEIDPRGQGRGRYKDLDCTLPESSLQNVPLVKGQTWKWEELVPIANMCKLHNIFAIHLFLTFPTYPLIKPLTRKREKLVTNSVNIQFDVFMRFLFE